MQNKKQQMAAFIAVVYTLTTITVFQAYQSSHSFLGMTLKLSQGINFLVMAIFTLLNMTMLWQAAIYLVFGRLRLIEQEHILERLPFTVINLIMMTSVFRRLHTAYIVMLGVTLLVLKVFHWILRDRLEGLLQGINDRTSFRDLFFTKFTKNLFLFGIIDLYLIKKFFWCPFFDFHLIENLNYTESDYITLIFGMEFGVLFLDWINLSMNTALNFWEFYLSNQTVENTDGNEEDEDDGISFNGLEGKFMYEKIIDVVTTFLRTLIHIRMMFPLKIQYMGIKDVIWDCLILYQGIVALKKIRQNNRQLDDKLPNLTAADLVNHDNICIVCMDDLVHMREEEAEEDFVVTQAKIDNMSKAKRPKKLPCGHMLHLSCLKNWMERSQTCPICRLAVFDEKGNIKLPTTAHESSNDTASERVRYTETPTPTQSHATTATPEPMGASSNITSSSSLYVQLQSQQTQQNHQQDEENDWYEFPIETTKQNAIIFTLHDSHNTELRSAITKTKRAAPVTIPSHSITY